MNLKLFCFIFILFIGSSALADAILDRSYSKRRTAIQNSSIVSSNYYDVYNDSSYNVAIKEIKEKLKQNPNDYILNVSLVDLYIKAKDYNNAYDELVFLTNLSMQNKLNSEVKNYLSTVYEYNKKYAKYSRNRANLALNLALLSLILGDNEKSEYYLNIAANSSLNSDLLSSTLKIIFDSTGNLEKAVSVCEKVILKNPNDIDLRKLKASYLVQNQNFDAAIIEYSSILDINPNDEDSKYSIYNLLSQKGADEKDIIKQIYKTDKPNYEIVYSEFADMLLNREEFDVAEHYADILVNSFPNNAKGYILLSEIYMKKGKLRESYDVLTEARDKADSNELIAKYNVLLAKLSDEPVKEASSLIDAKLYEQALDVLDSASQENLYVILTQARANYLMNNKQATYELLNKSMILYPKNSDVYCAFGYIYLQENDLESARKYVNNSLKINPKNKTALDLQDLLNSAESQKYINSIISSYEAQNYTESMRLVDEALKINKKDPNLYFYKALNYIAQNNYAASTAHLYKCLELDKNNIQVYFYLGLAFDNLSESKNALTYYKKYIELLPKDVYGESEKLDYAKARISKLQN